jgi:Cysteine-rich secretory protein family
MRKFLKSLFIPTKDNNFLPRIIGFRALILYCFLSVAVFFLVSPIFVQMNRLLANLTQELIISEINPIRIGQGFLSLKPNDKLTQAAQLKAEDMIVKDYFDHVSPDGKYPWQWLKEEGYDYAAAAENLAINASDPKALVTAWLNSPPHAENILNGYFTDIGVGIAKGEIEGKNTTVVVMFLGREVPESMQVSGGQETLASTIAVNSVPAQQPALMQTVSENTSSYIAKIDQTKIPVSSTSIRIFMLSEFPLEARFTLTLFFNIIVLWILGTFLISKEKFPLRVFNSLVVVALLFFLWLPEIV